MSDFGVALRGMRAELGLSQLDLAGAIGTTQRHISFLETGRSRPTRDMLGRLTTGLSLSLAQRAQLYEASGFASPFRTRPLSEAKLAETLDMLDQRLLAHWPFPGLILDRDWTILRANAPAQALLAALTPPSQDTPQSMFDVFLSRAFLDRLENWEELALAFYFRMQAAATRAPDLAAKFAAARDRGLFDTVPDRLAQGAGEAVLIPAVLRGPDGVRLSMTSLLGHLATAQDTRVEGLEIELMMPMDDTTQTLLQGAG